MTYVNAKVKRFTIPQRHELRFALAYQNNNMSVTLKVEEGNLYLNGFLLEINKDYQFDVLPISLFTDEIEAKVHIKIPIQKNNRIQFIIRSNTFFTDIKNNMSLSTTPNRNIIVVGDVSSGKTSICKWLINTLIAHNDKKEALYVNLDPRQPLYTPSKCISALPLRDFIVNGTFPQSSPLVYYYGDVEITEEYVEYYLKLLEELALYSKERLKHFKDSSTGLVIDFPSVTSEHHVRVLSRTVREFDITDFIVVGDERLSTNINKTFPKKRIFSTPPLPGAVAWPRHKYYRAIEESYFEGTIYSQKDITQELLQQNVMNIYSYNKDNIDEPKTEKISPGMKDCILAIVSKSDKKSVLLRNVLGFARLRISKEEVIMDIFDGSIQLQNYDYIVSFK